eukprot:TRINITY_DN66892_c0_g1_i1.p1 TRINITY_DN66892_c0_g1~~TRINITY_DN66892_c0_g1_i1.p1  ORF type:complete len:448 (+),score=37.75 TRINITY_DN66892_c0_g1_i1:60-1346(+)
MLPVPSVCCPLKFSEDVETVGDTDFKDVMMRLRVIEDSIAKDMCAGPISCLCGEVSIHMKSAPAKRVLCHCADCRRWTGSLGHFAAWFSPDDVDIHGQLLTYTKRSRATRFRRNCANCYSCIAAEHIDPEANLIEVCIGGYPFPVHLDAHLFYCRPLVDMRDGVSKFIDAPEILGGSGILANGDRYRAFDEVKSWKATCVCEAVTLTVHEAPVIIGLCHCQGCRKWTGSVGHLAVCFRVDSVKIRGYLKSYTDTVTGTGKRWNCATCFSCVMSKHEGSDCLELCGALLSPSPLGLLQAHFHYEERALSIFDQVPKFHGLPRELGGPGELLGEDSGAYVVVISHNGGRPLGLRFWKPRLRPSDVGRICEIVEGSVVYRWNKSMPSKVIRVHDRLLSVNGKAVTTEEALKDVTARPGKLELLLSHHEPIE